MLYSKEQIVSKITQISNQRRVHELALSKLQIMLNTHKKYKIVQLRNQFEASIQLLNKTIRENQTTLDHLKYRGQKLSKDGAKMENQLINIEALKEYFLELKQKVVKERKRGEQIISGRQRWELLDSNGTYQMDEEESLLGSQKVIKETKQMALNVYENINEQGSRIEQARMKMGSVLKNINFAGNIAQMIKTRTAEDNRLIMRLTIGLFLWILVCLFIIKPWVRGQ